MWTAITYVSGGLTLIAFIVAVAASLYRQKILQKQKLILTAAEEDRQSLVMAALEFFNVDPAALTKQQQFDLAMQQIKARATRFLISSIVVTLIAILGVPLTAFAIWYERGGDDSSARILDEQARNSLLNELSKGDSAPVIRQKAIDQLQPYNGKNFSHCNFNGLDLHDRDFSGAILNRVTFVEADLTDATLRSAQLKDADFVKARMRRANLTNADLSGARISSADLRNADFSGAQLIDADIGEVNGNEFKNGVLISVIWSSARLTGADFTNTNFQGANLKGVDLSRLDLSQSRNLTQTQIQAATVDAQTRLPVPREVSKSAASE
jgi:Pentapeptide repeats (9 copies)/Pentapeptide repeats (8 copies)